MKLNDFISNKEIVALIRRAKREDLGRAGRLSGDVTSRLTVSAAAKGIGEIRSRKTGVLAGGAMLPVIANEYDRRITVRGLLKDGASLKPGSVVARVSGPLRSLLAMERVALNFATHLSGIATQTSEYVRAVSSTRGRPPEICDTRKTIPGLRRLEKYAVVCGGGKSHRMGLHDAVLVKDNHIAHVEIDRLADTMTNVVKRARKMGNQLKFIEVEVENLEQLAKVLGCGVDIILLDNMPVGMLRQAVAMRDRIAPKVILEASGGVNLETVAGIARTGVDRISVGAITHSAPALDLGLDML